ncbi:MAG: ATP-binding protein [Bacteroidota bacterium]
MGEAGEAKIAFLLFLGIIGMLLLAIAVVLFFLVYQRRLLAQQDQIREMELEYQKQSLDAIIQAQEAERKRIAQDLHDEVGSKLSATKLFVKRLSKDRELKEFDHLKTETVEVIDETIINIRSITRNLLPMSLDRFGLVAAVDDLCKRIRELALFEIDFQHNLEERLPAPKEFALYRILQELINNTTKHAAAKRVDISLSKVDQQLMLHYQDDGKGFDLNLAKKVNTDGSGLGLRSIESRVNWLEGEMDWSSSGQKGFALKIRMAIP